jgi:glutamyl-tRNA reductase
MHRHLTNHVSSFFVAGINYKKTDALARGTFAIGSDQYEKILSAAAGYGVEELMVLSTCNRTEIYGFAEDPDQLIALLCTQTAGSAGDFRKLAYIKQGISAIQHIFSVGAGLDSQILGDYEIVGQIKQSMKFAKDRGFVGPLLDRILSFVLQCSRTIKKQTRLSDGTVSVSFAAVQYIREHVANSSSIPIALIGTGKIGRNTCKNLVDYLGSNQITLINRTEDKAEELAVELGLQHAPMEQMDQVIRDSDIIVVATNAEEPIIRREHLDHRHPKLIIDLSIPYNVEKEARELDGITLVDVDQLSRMKDETLLRREAEVPKALDIIEQHAAELLEWFAMRKNVPLLKSVKTKLREIHSCPLFVELSPNRLSPDNRSDERIQRVLNGMAVKMRRENQLGCHYIEAINEFIAG